MLKNSLFKLNRNRKFNYKPRYFKEENEQLNYFFDSRIRGSREDHTQAIEVVLESRKVKKEQKKPSFNKLFFIILFLLFLYFFM